MTTNAPAKRLGDKDRRVDGDDGGGGGDACETGGKPKKPKRKEEEEDRGLIVRQETALNAYSRLRPCRWAVRTAGLFVEQGRMQSIDPLWEAHRYDGMHKEK